MNQGSEQLYRCEVNCDRLGCVHKKLHEFSFTCDTDIGLKCKCIPVEKKEEKCKRKCNNCGTELLGTIAVCPKCGLRDIILDKGTGKAVGQGVGEIDNAICAFCINVTKDAPRNCVPDGVGLCFRGRNLKTKLESFYRKKYEKKGLDK